MSGAWGAEIAGAAALAVERVNADNTLLPGRQLEFSWRQAGCSAKQGLAAMGELIKLRRIDAVIGPSVDPFANLRSLLTANADS